MAKYNGPVCRFCRREAQKLFLKGERCLTDRCAFERRGYAPGQHGPRRAKSSEYGVQLREKQKVRRTYGLMETPFRNQFQKAATERGITADLFFQRLEMRLDNVVYRMGFARSRQEGKQIVRHNHILVNGKRVNIPSVVLRAGDTVAVTTKSKQMGTFAMAQETYKKRPLLPWLEVDGTQLSGKVIALPQRADIQMNVKERLVVELYSK